MAKNDYVGIADFYNTLATMVVITVITPWLKN